MRKKFNIFSEWIVLTKRGLIIFCSNSEIHNLETSWFIQCWVYRTLHSYKLFWAVCHLFPQRWRTLNIQSRETIGQEDHVICLKLRRRAQIQVLRLWATYKTVFSINTSSSSTLFLFDQISPQQQHHNGPRRHSYTRTMRRFPVSEKLPVSNYRKRTIQTCNSFCSLVVLHTHTHTHTS